MAGERDTLEEMPLFFIEHIDKLLQLYQSQKSEETF